MMNAMDAWNETQPIQPIPTRPPRLSQAELLAKHCSHLHGSAPSGDTDYCPQYADLIPLDPPIVMCWNFTEAGASAAYPCPVGKDWDANAFATKYCSDNGTWLLHPKFQRTFVNLLPCIKKTNNYVVWVSMSGYSISILALVISLIIFRAFRQLQCERLTLHKHLFTCYLLNAVVWIVLYVMLGNTKAMQENWNSCKILNLIASYFSLATYMWMLCEGLYLVVILVFTFVQNTKSILNALIVVGWVLPLLLTFIYATVRWTIENPKKCWSQFSKYLYILQVPVLISLSLNIVFVVIIIFVLIMKLRSPVSPDQQQGRKAAKAIVILVPLLGIQYIFTLVKAEQGVMKKAHEYIVAVFVSFQGLLVAVLFCFLNQEVHTAVGRAINRRRYNTCDFTESTAMNRRVSRVANDRRISRCDRASPDAGPRANMAANNATAGELLKPPEKC